MEAELAALATSGATTLVGLMVSDAWGQGRSRLARFFARGDATEAEEEELETSRDELVAARQAGDEEAAGDIQGAWRQRLRRVLQADPQAAAELRELLAELAPAAAEDLPSVVVNNSVNGTAYGPVFQGQHFQRMTFNDLSAGPAEPGAEDR